LQCKPLADRTGTQVEMAVAARVVVARHELEWLHEHGEIAALLRW